MPTANDIIYGFAIPATVAMAIFFALRIWFTRGAAALATVGGWVCGIVLLELSPFKPTSHWHWLPCVGLVSAVTGIALAQRKIILRGSVWLVLIAGAAFLLTPDWADLKPSRTVHIAAWSALSFIAVMINSAAVSRASERTGLFALVVMSMTTVVVAFLADNARFAQMAMALTAAVLGIFAVEFFFRKSEPDAIAAVVPAELITLLVCGLLLVAKVNSFSAVPLVSYVLPAFLPAALFVGRKQIDAESTTGTTVVRLCSLMIISSAAIGVAVWYVNAD